MSRAIVLLTAITVTATGMLTAEAWAGKKAVKGQHIPEGVITMRKAGGDPQTSGKATVGTSTTGTARRAR
jgi:hypothetical protein